MQEQVYSFEIKQPISEKQIITSAFEERKPSVCASTIGGKIFSYNLYDDPMDTAGDSKLKWLNFNKKINFVTTGKIIPGCNRDVIIVASETTLTVYDPFNNYGMFHRDIPDGITAIKCGYFGTSGAKSELFVFVGSNCSIQAFDHSGDEKYWNVTGDNVLSICFCDIDSDESYELIVGCEDHTITIFKGENIETEVTESAPVTDQISFGQEMFGFALKNGCIGVHDKKSLIWKHKQKDHIIGIATYISDEHFDVLISGYRNGRVDMHNAESGENVFTTQLSGDLSALFKGNLLPDKGLQIVCAMRSGQILGYNVNYEKKEPEKAVDEVTENSNALNELIDKKNNLLSEINSLNDLKNQRSKEKTDGFRPIIPENTRQLCAYRYNYEKNFPELHLKTNNTTIIRGVIVNGEKLFKIDSLAYSNPESQQTFIVPILAKDNQEVELKIKVIIGQSIKSKDFKVLEMAKTIPKFACFSLTPDATKAKPAENPVSSVQCRVKDRINRVKMWLENSFNLSPSQQEKCEETNKIELSFINIRNSKMMKFSFDYDSNYYCEINHDDMEMTSEIIQDMCNYQDIKDQDSYVSYPKDMDNFREILDKIGEMSKGKIQHIAGMANSIQILKRSMVRSEEARLLNDMKSLKSNIATQNGTNKTQINELKIKTSQQEAFLDVQRKVNAMISVAGNLRHGQFKTKVVSSCREAIKDKNFYHLLHVIQGDRVQFILKKIMKDF